MGMGSGVPEWGGGGVIGMAAAGERGSCRVNRHHGQIQESWYWVVWLRSEHLPCTQDLHWENRYDTPAQVTRRKQTAQG